MPTAFTKDLETQQNNEEKNSNLPDTEIDDSHTEFGKIFLKPNLNITELKKTDEMPSQLISRRELGKGSISREEMETLSVFRSYEPGGPN